MNAIVTTSRDPNKSNTLLAEQTAATLGIPFVQRQNSSLDELRNQYEVTCILVAKNNALTLETPDGELFFHPNMSHLRVKNLRKDQPDNMAKAMGLKEGMRVLDCTLGFGADAIVASFVTGAAGRVVGLEASPLIAAVTAHGLASFSRENEAMTAAMRRIEVVNTDALAYLQAQPDNAFDIVYFDPMFRHPLMQSENMNPLRYAAEHAPVSAAMITEARRVARCRVVLKETSKSTEFARLGFSEIAGGKYSPVHYGVWRKASSSVAMSSR